MTARKTSSPWPTLRMADLTNHHPKSCQFIMGEDHYMCGKPGFPYCEEHKALCHVPYEPKPDSIHNDLRHTRPRHPRTVIGGKWS